MPKSIWAARHGVPLDFRIPHKDDSFTPIDFDALPAVDLDVPGAYLNEQISQEFQLLYDGGGPLTGLLGFYYLDAKADTIFDVRLFTTVPGLGLTAFTRADVDTETYAVFGDFTFDLTEQLSASLGGRYTWDERTASILRQQFLFGGSPFFGGPGVPAGAPQTDFTGSAEFKKFTPRASVSFMPTLDHNFYASYSKGFKGGGFDPRGVGTTAPDLNDDGVRSDDEIADFLSFEPEEVESYELGYKGSLLDGAVNVALAAFYADYTDVQIPGSVACTVQAGTPPRPTPPSAAWSRTRARRPSRGSNSKAAHGSAAGSTSPARSVTSTPSFDEYITNIPGLGPTDVAEFREVQNTPQVHPPAGLSATMRRSAPATSISAAPCRTAARHTSSRFPTLTSISPVSLCLMPAWFTPRRTIAGASALRKEPDRQAVPDSGYTFVRADPITGEIPLGANGFPIPTLGPEGTLTAFYGNPRQVFVSATFEF